MSRMHSTPLFPAKPGQPRRKVLVFNQLQVTYDYETKTMTVVRADDLNEKFSFSVEELAELKAALLSFGMETPDPGQVTCR